MGFGWLRTIPELSRPRGRFRLATTGPALPGEQDITFYHLGLLDGAQSEAKAAKAINPDTVTEPLRVRGVAAMFAGRFDEAVRLLDKARSASGRTTEWNLAYAYYYAGRQTDAEAMLYKMSDPSAALNGERRRHGQASWPREDDTAKPES